MNELIKKLFVVFLLLSGVESARAQHSISLKAVLNDSLKTFTIDQELNFHNTSQDTLHEIVLNDWNNAFSSKESALAIRFSEEYFRKFHFAKPSEWGGTSIQSISGGNSDTLKWERPAIDLLKVQLETPLLPGERIRLRLQYTSKIPHEKFTHFGYTDNGNYKLQYWFLTPAVYDGKWQSYSHKDLDDQYVPLMNLDLHVNIPSYLAAISAVTTEEIERQSGEGSKSLRLVGENQLDTKLYLTRNYQFEDLETEDFSVLTNMDDEGLSPPLKHLIVTRIARFLNERIGPYPHSRMLVTEEDYASSPFYGLHQLPKFIRPFPEGFNYELKQLKTITENYLENVLLLNPRKEYWITDAMHTYLMMEYVDTYYPELKILGTFSEVIGVRWFHAAELEFNDQYSLFYQHMARIDLDQALSASRDSLVKFNRTIGNPYKAGAGLKYLEDFLGGHAVSESIKEFYTQYQLKKTDAKTFEKILKKNSPKKIDWFFDDYVGSNSKIDFKIRSVKKKEDSLEVSIRNKYQNNMPVSIYGLNNKKEIVYQTWVEDVEDLKEITIPAEGIQRIALNYEGKIPEVNQRDNYKAVGTFLDKPLQVRLLKDIEDPRYTQLFFMPDVKYNLYDGVAFGPRLYNSTFLRKNFEFQIAPLYGSRSQTLVGGLGFFHDIQFHDQELYKISYGFNANRFSYGYNLFYEKFTPFLTMSFREADLRNNRRQLLTIRNVNVFRDQNLLNPLEVPDYNVFNVNYRYSDPGMVDYFTGNVDFQLSQHFSKLSFTSEYRKLFKNNRQINLRFFGGAFIYNDQTDSDYFSFALDRPTDYLYDYNYYGRSETSGLFSQQIIMAEGGFKSQLQPEFANQWLTAINASTNIWKWIYAYGDVGLVKNKYENAKFLYDSGIRLSFIADYFEIFFPVYSNLGWEITQENYDQRIRFIATLDIRTLLGLFSREWY